MLNVKVLMSFTAPHRKRAVVFTLAVARIGFTVLHRVIWKTMAFDLAPGGCEVTDTSHLVEGENGFEVKGQGASCLLHALKRFGLPEK